MLSTRTIRRLPDVWRLEAPGRRTVNGGLERYDARRREGVLRLVGLRCAPPLAQLRSSSGRLSESAAAGAERPVTTTAVAASRRRFRSCSKAPRLSVTATPATRFGATEKRTLP